MKNGQKVKIEDAVFPLLLFLERPIVFSSRWVEGEEGKKKEGTRVKEGCLMVEFKEKREGVIYGTDL